MNGRDEGFEVRGTRPGREFVLVERPEFSLRNGADLMMPVSMANGVGEISEERSEGP